jgi:thiol:disulfide interchange protein
MNAGIRTLGGWVAGVSALALLAGGCSSGPKEQAHAWKTSFDVALADAGESKRPILLDFYTDW